MALYFRASASSSDNIEQSTNGVIITTKLYQSRYNLCVQILFMKTFPFELLQSGKVELRCCFLAKYIVGLSTCWSCNHRSGYPLENYSVKVTPFLENISRYEEYKTRVNEMFLVKEFWFILRISGQEQVRCCGGEVELGHDNHLPFKWGAAAAWLWPAWPPAGGGRAFVSFPPTNGSAGLVRVAGLDQSGARLRWVVMIYGAIIGW